MFETKLDSPEQSSKSALSELNRTYILGAVDNKSKTLNCKDSIAAKTDFWSLIFSQLPITVKPAGIFVRSL